MKTRADPRPDDDGLVEYRVDSNAPAGNVIPALARRLFSQELKMKVENEN